MFEAWKKEVAFTVDVLKQVLAISTSSPFAPGEQLGAGRSFRMNICTVVEQAGPVYALPETEEAKAEKHQAACACAFPNPKSWIELFAHSGVLGS